MDDAEWQQVLEQMAGTASQLNGQEDLDKTVHRWQKLFGFTRDMAIDRITEHRNDLAHLTVSDEHWQIAEAQKPGYDQEAYEFELTLERQKAMTTSALQDTGDTQLTYLVELKGPLADVNAIVLAAGMTHEPVVLPGMSAETWEAVQLCSIDAKERIKLLHWASSQGFEPTIIVNPKSMQ